MNVYDKICHQRHNIYQRIVLTCQGRDCQCRPTLTCQEIHLLTRKLILSQLSEVLPVHCPALIICVSFVVLQSLDKRSLLEIRF